MWVNPADRRHTTLKWIIRIALKTDRTGFGHAIGDRHFAHMHFANDALHDFDRAWGARHYAGAQTAQVILGKIRMIEFGDEHGRHAMQRRAALGGNCFEYGFRFEGLTWKDHGGAMGYAHQDAHHHAKTMIERDRDTQAVLVS